MADHTVKSYDEDLGNLKKMVALMGGLAEEQLANAIAAISRNDTRLADETIAHDSKIDLLERQIEEKAILTIAKRQPMALDLRQIMVTIKIAADLERIGDLAKNTAKRTHAITEAMPRKLITGLARMGDLAQEQLKSVLDAYAHADAEKAMQVWRADEDIDAMYNSIFRELLTYMMEDPRNIGPCTHLLFGTKNMERIGDHATNIAENIFFLVHGRALDEERPKKDKTSMTAIPAKA
jgi:phosphate transport system protein